MPRTLPPQQTTSPLRILFYSGSIGLGHVTRDLAIARAIRESRPDAHIEWLASSPAREHLAQAGEHLHPHAHLLSDATSAAEAFMRRGRFNITRWAVAVRKTWAADGRVVLSASADGDYDVLIGDEAYDVAMALTGGAPHPRCNRFILYDFLGLDRMGRHPLEWVGVEAINRAWAREPGHHYQAVFLGETADISERPFGRRGPSRRSWAEQHASVVGHVVPFAVTAAGDRASLKVRAGYGPEPLIIVSVGGTGAGAQLLRRCLEAFPLVRREIPQVHMVLVGGPRLDPQVEQLPAGAELRRYVPRLHEHFAACDLAVVQGGGATTLELTVLQRPFLFAPLRGHCEQVRHVAARQARLGAGVPFDLRRTRAGELSRLILSHIGREVCYPLVPTDGAHRVAELVLQTAAGDGDTSSAVADDGDTSTGASGS